MILTTKTKYAVMGVLYIAKKNQKQPITLSEVAAAQNIALGYLEQLFQKLKARGIVKSVKGPGGGYLLNRNYKEITIGNIINAVEENIKLTRCHDNGKTCLKSNERCLAHNLWKKLEYKIQDHFSQISLYDVITDRISFAS